MTARPAGDKPKSFNHRRSLDSAAPQRQRRRRPVPGRSDGPCSGWTDGLATIGLINGRDQEGLRPQRRDAEHERDPGSLTRCRWPHTPAAADWHKSANATPEARLSARRRRHGGWANGRRALPAGVALAASLAVISGKIIRQTEH